MSDYFYSLVMILRAATPNNARWFAFKNSVLRVEALEDEENQ